MRDLSSKGVTTPRRGHIPDSGTRMFLLLSIAVVGAIAISPSANATSITVTNPFLFYANQGPSAIFGAGGEYVGFGANSVVPNGGASPATTGTYTTTNVTTGSTISGSIPFLPAGDAPNQFYNQFLICTTGCSPTANNSQTNLANPWTLTFKNTGATPTSVPTTLSLAGPGEIPFAQSVTLSGTGANPTFSWSAPSGLGADGYRIQIFQNTNSIIAANLTQPTYTVPTSANLSPNTTYTISIELLTTRDGSTTNLNNSNIAALSRVYSTFQILPAGSPPVNLPTVTLVGSQVIYGFNLTVQPGLTYFIDPAVATGYMYQISPGNPNFATVLLPDLQGSEPYTITWDNGLDTKQVLGGDIFSFLSTDPLGVSEFTVTGIDPNLGLAPSNPTAFITGLTFEGSGNFTGTMTPITTDVSGVPEPGSLALLASGLLGFGLIRRRRKEVPGIPTVSN